MSPAMCAPKELTSQAAIMAIDGGTCCKPIGVCVFYGRPTLGKKKSGTFVSNGNANPDLPPPKNPMAEKDAPTPKAEGGEDEDFFDRIPKRIPADEGQGVLW